MSTRKILLTVHDRSETPNTIESSVPEVDELEAPVVFGVPLANGLALVRAWQGRFFMASTTGQNLVAGAMTYTAVDSTPDQALRLATSALAKLIIVKDQAWRETPPPRYWVVFTRGSVRITTIFPAISRVDETSMFQATDFEGALDLALQWAPDDHAAHELRQAPQIHIFDASPSRDDLDASIRHRMILIGEAAASDPDHFPHAVERIGELLAELRTLLDRRPVL